jgi:hypothetical protein
LEEFSIEHPPHDPGAEGNPSTAYGSVPVARWVGIQKAGVSNSKNGKPMLAGGVVCMYAENFEPTEFVSILEAHPVAVETRGTNEQMEPDPLRFHRNTP